MDSSLLRRVAAWFTLSREERWWVLGLLALFLVGLMARWWHVTHRAPVLYVPPGLEEKLHE